VIRRLLLVALAALAFAAPASAFSKENGTQAMDDGVAIAITRYTPDGTTPAGGWPGVLVLHGLAGTRGTVEAISSAFATAGYAVLAYDARGHGASEGEITLAGPREVADLRALRASFAARPDVHDTKIGAWGISYGGGQIWNALGAGVPFAAVEVLESWTNLYDALWPQSLARSGIVAGFAAGIAARSPLVSGIRDNAVQSTNVAELKQIAAARSVLPRNGGLGSIKTPVYLFQGRIDFAFDLTQATQAFASLGGPKKLYAGTFGHTPSTFPGPDGAYVLSQGIAWFDRFLKGTVNGVEAKPVVIAKQGSGIVRTELAALPRTRPQAFELAGTSTIRGGALVSRRTGPLRAPLETWGAGTATVEAPRLASYPRLVVTVLAGSTVVSQGGLKPRRGANVVKLANYCVFVPKGTRLRVTVGSASPPGQFAYLGFAGAGSATIGTIRLQLSTLVKPVSG
jgi:pimeloyl-ACP methyl ester carboxylesterase